LPSPLVRCTAAVRCRQRRRGGRGILAVARGSCNIYKYIGGRALRPGVTCTNGRGVDRPDLGSAGQDRPRSGAASVQVQPWGTVLMAPPPPPRRRQRARRSPTSPSSTTTPSSPPSSASPSRSPSSSSSPGESQLPPRPSPPRACGRVF
jgi:hypothetical protein